jgi:hypothetical protein
MPNKKLTTMRTKRKEMRRHADDRFTRRVLGVISFLLLWTFCLYFFNWPLALFILPAGGAMLFLLAIIYPRDFTVLALFISGGALGLWLLTLLYQRTSGRWNMLAHILFAAAIIGFAVVFRILFKKGGVVSVGRFNVVVIPRKGRYVFLFTACGVIALALAASMIFGSSASLYAMTALFCYLFVAAVYYTVKLI